MALTVADEYRALADLTPHARNYNLHSDRQIEKLANKIRHIGFTAPFILKADGTILGGHLRRLALAKLQAESYPEPKGVKPGWRVPCRVVECNEAQELAILAGDNPDPAEIEFDSAGLAAILAELQEQGVLEASGYDEARLEALIGELAGGAAPESGLLPGADPDEIPEAVETRCKSGDLWKLGRHRVLCGDSTKADDVGRLMGGEKASACVTDPPYNVDLGYDETTDDAKSVGAYEVFSRGWFGLIECETRIVTPGCSNLAFWLGQMKPQAMGVWTKLNSMTRASATRFNCWEPLLFWGCKNSDRAHDVFDFPTSIHFGGAGSGIADPHPCPKPVKLWSELLSCYTDEEALLYEPFLGSGTTVVAAEDAGRRCFGTEHSPHYVDIAIARFEALTGQTAELLERVN